MCYHSQSFFFALLDDDDAFTDKNVSNPIVHEISAVLFVVQKVFPFKQIVCTIACSYHLT
jgi:hypothetical protein